MEKLKNKMVLIVDDDIGNIFAQRSYLEMPDMKTAIAENGEQAISALHSNTKPDIILLSMMVPVTDGWYFKKDTSLKQLP